ncbi:TPA: hypothetical protein ACKP9S_002749 [Pseudomonas aeruginosa]
MKLFLAIAVLSAAAFQYLPSHFVESSQVAAAMQKHHQMIAEVSQ